MTSMDRIGLPEAARSGWILFAAWAGFLAGLVVGAILGR